MKHLGTWRDAMYCGSSKDENGMQACLKREGGKSERGYRHDMHTIDKTLHVHHFKKMEQMVPFK